MSGEFSAKTREQIIERDGGRCQWKGCPIGPDTAYSIQHRRARGQGGSKDLATSRASNGVLMCGTGTTGCHGYVESHRTEARERGFNVSLHEKAPASVPIVTFEGTFVLDDLGGRADQEVSF